MGGNHVTRMITWQVKQIENNKEKYVWIKSIMHGYLTSDKASFERNSKPTLKNNGERLCVLHMPQTKPFVTTNKCKKKPAPWM